MKIKVVNFILSFVFLNLGLLSLDASAASRSKNKNEEVEIPVQLKPERMKLLERIANEKVVGEELPFSKETSDLMKKMLVDKDDYIVNPPIDIQTMSRTLTVPMGIVDGEFEKVFFSPNNVTTLVFVDKLGNPWTIKKQSISAPSKVHPEVVNANMITFSPKTRKGHGNMMLLFKDSNYPITLEWEISEEKLDYVTEIKIDDYGNQSPKNNMMRLYVGGSSVNPKYNQENLSTMLSGNTPYGFKLKEVFNEFGEKEEDFKVWFSEDGENMYIRTIHKVNYPPILSTKKSGDKKTKIIKGKKTSRITVVKNGQLLHLKVK
jgi:hypothetical protein